MREVFRRILTDRRWFLGFIVVATLLILFFWRIIAPVHFVTTINRFFEDLMAIIGVFLVLAIMLFGVRYMFGWRPFQRNNNRGRGGH